MSETDPVAAVHAWSTRMSMRYGPRVWDQEAKRWLTWEQALSKRVRGTNGWILDTPAWAPGHAESAILWEFGWSWPDWAVKAHLVDKRPCEFEDHQWRFSVEMGDCRLVCLDACEEPRVFCDEFGRYVYPACQNVPDMDFMCLEVTVKPEWVYHHEEDWWLDLIPQVADSEVEG